MWSYYTLYSKNIYLFLRFIEKNKMDIHENNRINIKQKADEELGIDEFEGYEVEGEVVGDINEYDDDVVTNHILECYHGDVSYFRVSAPEYYEDVFKVKYSLTVEE